MKTRMVYRRMKTRMVYRRQADPLRCVLYVRAVPQSLAGTIQTVQIRTGYRVCPELPELHFPHLKRQKRIFMRKTEGVPASGNVWNVYAYCADVRTNHNFCAYKVRDFCMQYICTIGLLSA